MCFVDRCLSFCTFSFGHFIVFSFSIYGFWLPLWYPQTLLREYQKSNGNGQSRETGNIGYTRRRKTKQKLSTICVEHHSTQTNTINVNEPWAVLQPIGGKEPNIVCMWKSVSCFKCWLFLSFDCPFSNTSSVFSCDYFLIF